MLIVWSWDMAFSGTKDKKWQRFLWCVARILSPGEFLFEGWSGLREPVHWSVWCLTCQRLLRKAGARLRWWSLQCAVGVQLKCFFLEDVATYARWTREPLWNRLAIWTSLPETSAGCQCTAKFLCRKSMDISITGTKRLPGVGRMCFKCSVLVKWVAKAASKNHRKENQRIQALTSSARRFLPYTESCKWCKTHGNSGSLPDFWPFQPVPTCVRNNPVQGDGGGKTFLTCHVNTNCLQTNVQQSVTQVMLYGDSESWAQQSTLIHAVFHWYGENLRAKFNGNLRMVGHCDVRKQRRALSALANFVQCSWCTLATFQLSDWFVAMVNIPFIWYNVYIYIYCILYTHMHV